VNTIFAVHYKDNKESFCAFVTAASQRQAVDVLWLAVVSNSAKTGPSFQEIVVDRVEPVGSVEELPFPEVVPPEPVVLAVMRLEGTGGKR
jgi:hypothetical protein